MHKRKATALLLTCALGLSSCASVGRAAKPAICQVLPPVPASLMQPPTTERVLRDELLEPAPKQTSKSGASKRSH